MVKLINSFVQLFSAKSDPNINTVTIDAVFVSVSADSKYVIFTASKSDKFYQQCKNSRQVCDSHDNPKQFRIMVAPVTTSGITVVTVGQSYKLTLGYHLNCPTRYGYMGVKKN